MSELIWRRGVPTAEVLKNKTVLHVHNSRRRTAAPFVYKPGETSQREWGCDDWYCVVPDIPVEPASPKTRSVVLREWVSVYAIGEVLLSWDEVDPSKYDTATWVVPVSAHPTGNTRTVEIPETPETPEPEPFKITGPGRYRQRDGGIARIEKREDAYQVARGYSWKGVAQGNDGTGFTTNWTEPGWYTHGCETKYDLISRIDPD